jgi:hypothetical protein|tara:strand:- start:889 stop:1227 length:339 start_codon:yes stop_codon:yes gene_type:complete
MLKFTLDVRPFFGVFQRIFLLGDVWPDLGQLGIEFEETLLIFWKLVLGEYSVDRALGLTQCTIDAFIRMDNEEVWSFIETVHWADFYTIGVFTLYASVTYHKRHLSDPFVTK